MAKKIKQIVGFKVTSKKDGFRRSGIVHSGTRIFEEGELTNEQIQSLKNEPLLIVEELEAEEDENSTDETQKQASLDKKAKASTNKPAEVVSLEKGQ